ncbi:NAD(P)-binding domain-containing protein [Caldovatus aquaticus]|uniref:NAD(P)-binding domain-containing protein n=1 Tax=Caldovatus aquaticus TaxID=2865671 RepID=A0ABS7F653_9PROT|nr:NAD(P)-binding domain-containing protein [Caldovatus aquaticus]MBW8271100.1 NAD(P)-binding domain-containing protein [Caldovatus aquaticus]
MTTAADVTVIGAGPYGLSVAAHLRALGVDHRILGRPMETWRRNMPEGMLLKSAGFASNLSDPERAFTLRAFCRQNGLPYEELDLPVPLETFCRYGLAFQERFVPHLEEDTVAALAAAADGFEVRTARGEAFRTRRVVLAVGIGHFRHVPETLAHLGPDRVSHSADHRDLRRFKGQRLAVIGAGSSAIELATLAHEAGAAVRLIARRQALGFDSPWGGGAGPRPWHRRLYRRLRWPVSELGPGWTKKAAVELPWLYRFLPDRHRLRIARTFLGPSGGWPLRERAATLPRWLGCTVQEARAGASGVDLCLLAGDGSTRRLQVDHVIAATGYSPDVHRLPFLGPDILGRMALIGRTPRLSADFESSVPGLYVVGAAAATTFGPLMRFAAGADFAARQVSGHLAALARARPGAATAFRRRTAWSSASG